MKKINQAIVLALSGVMAIGLAACDNNPGDGPQSGNYADPDTAYTTYDNKAYNEYLMGDETVIADQWDGYGIGDPFVMRWNGKYYLYCSTPDALSGVKGYVSADLVNWVPMTGEGLAEGLVSDDPVTLGTYAPEVYYFNGTFYMYTSPLGAGHYILTSDSPEGPFVKATDNFGLAIDGSVLIDDDESMYFTYANDSGIRMARMTDMLTVDTTSTPVLNGTSIGGWTEGSYLLKRDGIYYLTYTGNHVTSDGYRIAYSTASSILTEADRLDRNAFTRGTNNPIALETEGDFRGLGHSSTVMGPDMDSYYLVYHTLNSSGGPNRSLAIDRLTFNGTMMSVAPTLEGSVTPTLPAFYATGADTEKFDVSDSLILSKSAAEADFTVEYSVTGAANATFVFGYTDADNYCAVNVDLTAKKITLSKVSGGASSEVASGTLKNDFAADKLHTVRVSVRDGVADVTFDNMTKIDNASLEVAAGKVGYSALPDGAQVGYTAFSNVAMGMSDQAEPKQATGDIGASNYLYEDTYADAYNFSDASGVSLVGDDANMLVGAKQLTLGADGDFASYLVRFGADARYGLEMVYAAADGGKTIEVTYGGTTYECTLPAVQTEDAFVKAIVCEFDAKAGISAVSIGSAGDAFTFVSVSFTETSPVTPVYEQSLATYAEKGADYKTIWKIKDEGHYAKAGTRQLVYFGDDCLTDFTLEVELKLEGNTGTSTAGIVFHAKNYAASSYDSYTSLQGYYLAVNNNQISLERLNYADGSTSLATVVANNPFATSDVFVSLKIVVRGNTIQVYTGGSDTPIIELTDTWAFTSGKLGLYTNGAAVVYKNLKVSA